MDARHTMGGVPHPSRAASDGVQPLPEAPDAETVPDVEVPAGEPVVDGAGAVIGGGDGSQSGPDDSGSGPEIGDTDETQGA